MSIQVIFFSLLSVSVNFHKGSKNIHGDLPHRAETTASDCKPDGAFVSLQDSNVSLYGTSLA